MGKQLNEIADIFFPNVSKERRMEILKTCCAKNMQKSLKNVELINIFKAYQLFIYFQ